MRVQLDVMIDVAIQALIPLNLIPSTLTDFGYASFALAMNAASLRWSR